MVYGFSVFLLGSIVALVAALVVETTMADYALKKRATGSAEPLSRKP
jgi:hypothetical protein